MATEQPDDFANYLLEQAKSPAVALHEFKLVYRPGEYAVHAFVEGEADVAYYLPAIRDRAEDRDVSAYMCGGKRGVIEVRNLIVGEDFPDALCLFFIDRDYDDYFDGQPPLDANTYLSDDYSIENDLVTAKAVEIILIDLARMSKADLNFVSIVQSFAVSRSSFVRIILPFLAWGMALRKAGKRPNFNNIDLSKMVQLDELGMWKKRSGAYAVFVKAVSQPGYFIDRVSLREFVKLLRSLPEKRAVRGKYELWFLESFMTYSLTRAINSGTSHAKVRVPTALKERSLFAPLGGRVPKPKSLVRFLNDKLQAR